MSAAEPSRPRIAAFHDARAAWHDTGPGHPERIARIEAAMAVVRERGLEVRPIREGWEREVALLAEIEKVHAPGYVHRLREACGHGLPYIDTVDSTICDRSFEAALAAAGCGLSAVEAVHRGELDRGLVVMRPPGHHCEANRSMGFCLFNNIAIAANWLTTVGGYERVAIVDFDVHHGNGTQHIFDRRSDVLFISTHEDPHYLYPGTGFDWETGVRGTPGEGHTLNVTFAPKTGHDAAVRALESRILHRLREYRPQFVLISAGFDADSRDPLAHLEWNPKTYEAFTDGLVAIANESAEGRLVSFLEGGYDLDALREDLHTHIERLASA